MKNILKQIAAQLHLWLGMISGLVVFVVALTGCLLVFEEELEPVLYPDFHLVEAHATERRLPLDHLAGIVSYKYPEQQIQRITMEQERDRTIVFNLKTKEKEGFSVAIDPYTGRITGDRDEHEAFFSVVLRLHRYLCLEETGKVITGISCVCFLVIMITGLVLWWPNRKNRKQRFTIKWGAKFKRLNWDLHAVAGFYVLPFIFLIALTGLVWSYPWVNEQLQMAFDGKPPTKKEAPDNLPHAKKDQAVFEKIYAQTIRELPHRGSIAMTFGKSGKQAVTVSRRDDEAAVDNIVSFLYFDQKSGALISRRLYENESRGFKARRLVFPIHTGSLLGWPTKILAFLAALVAATLPVTGIVIWIGRKFKSKKPKKVKALYGKKRVQAKVLTQE
ncbi:PepSY-associated TM helix domain-containing protein [Dyadobacter sandarakinus]|uniref:PepSY domain-containing protein n=1 Tax=Dyadobacter sandarakinus TaxID=2747268 RepID=A0ABX7I8C1_9BACT|nr:PepSY-associated TM helix domain-containing protein [Dyadobacter sandarakinus]QRR02349.1 PepSY domain-containing protein [Dyadobacter sandarakinus]